MMVFVKAGVDKVMTINILVVDDEKTVADLIEVYLKSENYNILKFYNGHDALQCVENESVDLAILDVMLPDMNGFSICQQIREKHHFPLIMLTAKDEEMVARVKAQLRRFTKYNTAEPTQEENTIVFSGLVLDKDKHECMLNEKPLSLTPTEFSILWVLASKRGRVVSSEELFHEVWGEKYFTKDNNTVMVHIRHLREKMHDNAEKPKYIKTVWGVGYKIEN
jgi:two-component system, OmpR family, response regulator VanR